MTAVELLPVHQFAHEDHLLRRGLRNYWGYNSIGYFAPHAALRGERHGAASRSASSSGWCARCTRPGSRSSSTWSTTTRRRRASWARRCPCAASTTAATTGSSRTPAGYADYTGCGNTLHVVQPHVLRLITDSLRYWVTEMGVDGFRFDLAAALARSMHDVDMLSPFLAVIAQDPVLRRVKLIAEPWDVGSGGYQVGAFPPLWTEWNDRYRDAVRDFWRGALPDVRDLGYRLSGSSDLYAWGGRRPYASVNFVTAHDGFTLRDLVSYERKHNEANGEGNRDGTDDNRSWNCGAEGETRRPGRTGAAAAPAAQPADHAAAVDGRADAGRGRRDGPHPGRQQQRVLPGQRDQLGGLVAAGGARAGAALLDLTARLIALRHAHPVLRRRAFFSGRAAVGGRAAGPGLVHRARARR